MASSGRMMRLSKDMKITAAKGQICHPVNDSLNHLNAGMSHGIIFQFIYGPEGSPYEGGTFTIDIKIPDRYPIDPPKCEFITRVYHPNIDDKGRICLSVLKSKPQGDWTPAHNVSTILDSLVILLGNPNPDDPLVIDIASEYSESRELFIRKAKDFTRRYAMDSGEKSTNIDRVTQKDSSATTSCTMSQSCIGPENSTHEQPLLQQHIKPGEMDKRRLKLPKLSMKRGSGSSSVVCSSSAPSTPREDNNGSTRPASASVSLPRQSGAEWNTSAGAKHRTSQEHDSRIAGSNLASGCPVEGDTLESACELVDATYEKHVAFLPSKSSSAAATNTMTDKEITTNDNKVKHLSEAPMKTKSPPQLSRKRPRSDDDGSKPKTTLRRCESDMKAAEVDKDPHTESHTLSDQAATLDMPKKSKVASVPSVKEQHQTSTLKGGARASQLLSSPHSRILTELPSDMINHCNPRSRTVVKEGEFDQLDENILEKVEGKLKSKRMHGTLSEPLSSAETTGIVAFAPVPLASAHDHQDSSYLPIADSVGKKPQSSMGTMAMSEPFTAPCSPPVTIMKKKEMDNAANGQRDLPDSSPLADVARTRTADSHKKGPSESSLLDLPDTSPMRLVRASDLRNGMCTQSSPLSSLSSSSSSSLAFHSSSSDPASSIPTSSISAAVKSPSSFLAARSTEEIVQVARKRDLMKKKKRAT
ncbi:Ubiquitin-conjugating enzyme E2 T [Actinomortierella wolfii]|nr:Ubiquitin-conjugating enzyme E2 T [Actinomortierella wolfii]